MATHTVARRTSLLKRLQLAANVLTAPNPYNVSCSTCRQAEIAIADRLEPSIDRLMDLTDRILAEHGPSLWDQIPRQNLGTIPLGPWVRHGRLLMAGTICLIATIIFIALSR